MKSNNKRGWIWALVLVLSMIGGCTVWRIHDSNKVYYMDISSIYWQTNIEIYSFKTSHHEGWSRPPKDAFDVTKTTKKRGTDSDGNTRYDTWYEYYTNAWEYERTVCNTGIDDNPIYSKITLVGDGSDKVGNEKIHRQWCEYHVCGICKEISSNILNYVVPDSIWRELTYDDWIQFKKPVLSDSITDVAICKNGDGVK